MYLQDFLGDPQAVIETAFRSPKLHPKKDPTAQVAMRVVGEVLADAVQSLIALELQTALDDALAMYEINNGEYGAWPQDEGGERAKSEYESGVDDVVETVLEPYLSALSADWLGRNTIDTGLWEATADDRSVVAKFARNAAKEMYKQLTYEKTPAQVLAGAGIVASEIETRLLANASATPERMEPMNDATTQSIVEKIKAHIGKGYDTMAVYEDLELMFEDDQILASSAGLRLGLTAADVTALAMASLDMGDDPAQDVLDMLTGPKPLSPSAARAEAKEVKAAISAAREAVGAPAGALPASVFEALKECGASDTTLSEQLGISRSTYTNYVKGKTFMEPNADQYVILREDVVRRANLMLHALAALDGSDDVKEVV